MTGPKKLAAQLLRGLGLLPLAMDVYQGLKGRASRGGGGLGTGPEDENGLALPGPFLRLSSAGTSDLGWFLESGKLARRSIEEGLESAGGELRRLGAILDLGCGCGRVLRQWADLEGPRIYGTDYNRRAVRWCRQNLPFARVSANDLEPPLPFEDASFDLVYALSVFTHLTARLQHSWMAEAHRVLRTDGHLVLTTHGGAYLSSLTEQERQAFERGELVVRADEVAGTNLCGAYHPEGWLARAFAESFEVAAFRPQGALGNPPQDLYVLRRLS